MPVEPITASLSILASVLSIARSVKELMQKRKIGKEEALKTFRQSASAKENALLDQDSVRISVLQITVISLPLLKQLEEEAQDCETKYINARKQAKGQIDRQQASIDVAQCMCSVLRDIKRHNKRVLPSGEFQNWWDSYACQD